MLGQRTAKMIDPSWEFERLSPEKYSTEKLLDILRSIKMEDLVLTFAEDPSVYLYVLELAARYEEVKAIADERDHWKSNHDSQVLLKRKAQAAAAFYRSAALSGESIAGTQEEWDAPGAHIEEETTPHVETSR
jgi:hypothetical protein